MRSAEEQIEALLRGGVGAWAAEQLDSPGDFDDRDFFDFISVSVDDVVGHVMAHGAPSGAVWLPGHDPVERDDRYVVESDGAAWKVYYAARNRERDRRVFARYDDAVRDAVMRVFDDAWVTLSHNYWHAHHPELERLPPFGAPWPKPKTRA